MKEFREPVVLEEPAELPRKELKEPVVLKRPALVPKKALFAPVVLEKPLRDPTKELPEPLVLEKPALAPMKELESPVPPARSSSPTVPLELRIVCATEAGVRSLTVMLSIVPCQFDVPLIVRSPALSAVRTTDSPDLFVTSEPKFKDEVAPPMATVKVPATVVLTSNPTR